MSDDTGIGPWGPHRDLHFAREHAKGAARQAVRRAALKRTIEESRRLLRERDTVMAALERAAIGGGHWHRLIAHDEELRARLDGLRRRARDERRLAAPTHAEILNEWSVTYDHLPPPAPGQLLLSRASKKPYRNR
ncbi:MAG: hypothetical protein AAGA93_16610 [Actinomycetota bacterium]